MCFVFWFQKNFNKTKVEEIKGDSKEVFKEEKSFTSWYGTTTLVLVLAFVCEIVKSNFLN